MTFRRMNNAPPDAALAINDPAGWIHGYGRDLAEHHVFWRGKEAEAAAAYDFPLHGLAAALHRELAEARLGVMTFAPEELRPADLLQRTDFSTHAREKIRKMALGGLAMSFLTRSGTLFKTLEPMHRAMIDGLGVTNDELQRRPIILQDMDCDEYDMPTLYAFHVSTAHADGKFPLDDSPDQWFKKRNLWVYRAETAVPSDNLKLELQTHNRNVDFSRMTTLMPYVASRAPLHNPLG